MLLQKRWGGICKVDKREQTQLIRPSEQTIYLLNVAKWVAIPQVKDYAVFNFFLSLLFRAKR